MKENAPLRGNAARRGVTSSAITPDAIPPETAPAQAHPAIPCDGISLGSFWRSPRDYSRAIQFSFREFNGTPFLDIRQYDNSSGFMIPSRKGVTLSIKQLAKFAAAAGKAHREAVKLGLITAVST